MSGGRPTGVTASGPAPTPTPARGHAPTLGADAAPSNTSAPAAGHFLRTFPGRGITVTRAEGSHVVTNDGRRLLDVGGASHGVNLIGHNHPRVLAAIHAQARDCIHVAQGMDHPARERMLARLHDVLPSSLSHTFLANSGTEAWECALKLAASTTGRNRFVAATGGFHGRTLGSLSTTHAPAYRRPFAGTYAEQAFVPFNDIDALQDAVGPDTAAVCLEPVQGEAGVVPATGDYLRAARDIAHDHGALLLLDEIQSGLGRTGPFLAASSHGVEPDVVTLAKGLAGGIPIGACSVTPAVAEAVLPGSHGSTYGGNPLAAAAATATLRVLRDEVPPGRAEAIGARIAADVAALEAPAVKEVRVAGAMVGIGLRVRPGPVLQALERAGVLALRGGSRGIRFLPPLTISDDGLDALASALRHALEAAP